MENIKFTDRYEALGIPFPDPKTMCPGQCEGTGWTPVKLGRGALSGDVTPTEVKRWNRAHWKRAVTTIGTHLFTCDGWHFVKCEQCEGTGKRNA